MEIINNFVLLWSTLISSRLHFWTWVAIYASRFFFSIFSAFKEKGKQTFQEIRLLTHQLKTTLYADILQQYNIESFSFF